MGLGQEVNCCLFFDFSEAPPILNEFFKTLDQVNAKSTPESIILSKFLCKQSQTYSGDFFNND
jgi:hypothetical protein